MTRDQKTVAIGAGSGVVTMIVAVVALYHLWPVPLGLGTTGDRIGYALKGLAFAVLPFLAMVIAVGNARFLGEAIDPTLNKESAAMEINGRVAENTLQQFILFAAALLALVPELPPERMRIVPAAVTWFVIARIAFWIGYRIHPLYRAFGFSSTIYLTFGLLAWAIWTNVT
jgi:hypothetical protein